MRDQHTRHLRALRAVAFAVVAAVNDSPDGLPSGMIYAGLLTQGCTREQYHQIMAGLESAGLVSRDCELYFPTEKGREFAGEKVAA